MSRFHLKGLDTFRGLAALAVVLSHIEFQKFRFSLPNLMERDFYKFTGGHIAVILFFVLSGFLITLLLLKEKEEFNTINLKDFYLRRIFRVWPLYYLILGLSYFLLDYSPSSLTVILCLTVFPNIAHGLERNWAGSPQIWSIGVEEQFYLAWPLIVKKSKNLTRVIILIFLLVTILPYGVNFIFHHTYRVSAEHKQKILNILFGAKFNCMAIGALAAIIFKERISLLAFFNRSALLSYIGILLPFILWILGFHTRLFNDECYAVLFALSILIVTSGEKIINPDMVITTFLGRISYGIYMYHWLILELLLKYKIAGETYDGLYDLKLYTLTIGLTLLTAYLSFRFLERPFLKLKEKYNRHPQAPKEI